MSLLSVSGALISIALTGVIVYEFLLESRDEKFGRALEEDIRVELVGKSRESSSPP
jgi:hypothetical protein